jgi:hypothetical protein
LRLTHDQVRQACGAKSNASEFECPLCHHHHLQLFKDDDLICQNGCDTGDIANWCRQTLRLDEKPPEPEPKETATAPSGSLKLVEYAMAKNLSLQMLEDHFGASEGAHPYYKGITTAVRFPYFDERGEVVTEQWRWSMAKGGRKFLANKPTYLYGGRFLQYLERLAEDGKGRTEVCIAEGESNTHTLHQNNIPSCGLPGVRNWKPEWAKLKLFKAAKRLYFFLDMTDTDGIPEDTALLGAVKVAESFAPGKVYGVKLPWPCKDISDLWLAHTTLPTGGGVEGFRSDLHEAILAAKPIIPERGEDEDGLPADLGDEVLTACPILKEFVELTLPNVETDVNNLICDFLACAGGAIGLRAYNCFGADKHSPATFHLPIGHTSSGKGVSWSHTRLLFEMAVEDWKRVIKGQPASSQALIRMGNDVAAPTKKDDEGQPKPNPDYNGGRLLVRTAEMSGILKSMKADWSTLSQTCREMWDGVPISNERADREKSTALVDPYALALIGDVTPFELHELISGIDFANGIANRFIWCYTRKTKIIPRAERPPDYTALAKRLARLIPAEPLGQIRFSEAGGGAWTSWVYGIETRARDEHDEDTALGSACGRMRPNALRLCVLFAVLDESRLTVEQAINEVLGASGTVAPEIKPEHVRAAAAIIGPPPRDGPLVLKATSETGRAEHAGARQDKAVATGREAPRSLKE